VKGLNIVTKLRCLLFFLKLMLKFKSNLSVSSDFAEWSAS